MEICARPRDSMRLAISRPVLMTHFTPCDWRSAIMRCKFSAIGGFSNSAKIVPSKSVEISLIGKLIVAYSMFRFVLPVAPRSHHTLFTEHGTRNPHHIHLRETKQQHYIGANGMTLQEQYDDAMFDFSTAEYDRAIEKLKKILAEDANY